MADSGIYEIVNLVNGKRYVGSAVDFKQRWHGHRSCLRREKHHSVALQRAWLKYGPDCFEFRVLENVEVSRLIEREQHHIDKLLPEYNCAPRAGSLLGHKFSAETRRKVGEASRRAWQDPDFRSRMKEVGRRAWDDKGRRAKGVAAANQKWADPNFRAKVSEAHSRREVTPEFCEAVREGIAARKAQGLPFARQINPDYGRKVSEETKEKLRQANLGKRATAEARRKMSESRTGKKRGPHSEETRAKMRAAWARRKAAASE